MITAYPALLVLGNIFMLLSAGVCGWWLVAPWSERLANVKFVAPFAGLLLLPSGALLFYAATGLTFAWSAAAAALALLTATALTRPWPRLSLRDVLILLITATAATLIVSPASFKAGEPAMLFLRGTDQAGYAQLANWLLHHTVHDAPVASSAQPLESWPAVMFASDPRFGSFAVLALISLLRGGPTLFSYDPAQALLLASAVLAIAGAFARGRASGPILGLALLTGAWLDLGSAGYLGKLFGYPAALLLGGLLAGADACPTERRLAYGATVVLFALAAASTYPGHVLALLAGAIGIAGTLAATLYDKGSNWRRSFGLQLTLMSMIAASFASGMVARPLQPGYPKWQGAWSDALAIALGTKSPSLQNLLPDTLSRAGGIACLAAGLILVMIANRTRNPVAFGLAAAPVGISMALLALGRTASLPQLVGFAGPSLLSAAALLVTQSHRPSQRMLAAGLFAMLIAVTAQTSLAALRAVWPSRDTDSYVLRQGELEGLIARLAGQEVILDVANPVQWSLSFMLLAGERMQLSYSKTSWNALFGYRGWPAPPESTSAKTRIVGATAGIPLSEGIAHTHQFLAVPSSLRPRPLYQLPEALLRDDSVGIWEDGWLERHAILAIPPGKATALSLVIAIPGTTAGDAGGTTLSLAANDEKPVVRELAPGDNRISLDLPESNAPRRLSLSFSKVRQLAAPDHRESAGQLLQLSIAP